MLQKVLLSEKEEVMKIQGVLEVEGLQLHIHMDVPDDARDVFVTNVPYDAQIVTRDRIRVESLAFPAVIIASLHQKGIRYLNRLLNEHWEPTLDHLDEEERREVLPVLKMFVDAALTPFRDSFMGNAVTGGDADLLLEKIEKLQNASHTDCLTDMPLHTNGVHPQSSGSQEFIAAESTLQEDVRAIGLPAGVTKELRDAYQIHTFADLRHAFLHRRAELLAGRYVTEKMIGRIGERLQAKGLIGSHEESRDAEKHES